jgi:cytochrome c oxidase subunit I
LSFGEESIMSTASATHTATSHHDAHSHEHDFDHANEPSYLVAKRGLASWMFTVDHKRIGLMYLASVMFFFLCGGLAALVVRTELFTNGPTIIDNNTYNRFFTVHGAIMVFLVIIPSVPAALGNFVLPLQLGAKDVAFPKLNLMSFYIYVVGAVMAVGSILIGGVDTGWTFYTPYSSTTSGSVITMVAAVFILGFSSIFTGMNFIVTIHKLRPPGMGWFRLPLFLWGIYSTSLIQVMATPVLAITLLLLIMERVIKVGIFDPALGGDPVLFQHFFWFYSHPAVYIMILPGMAVMSELIATFTKKRIFGYRFVAFSSLAIAIISFIVWGHHMFVSGQSELSSMVFSFLTFLVAIPSGVKVFNWIATMYEGSVSWKTPMLYAMCFLFLFTIGGLTGIFLGTLSVDVHLHDTYFVVAHFHYVMMGGTIIAFIGGIFYWWPKMTGKMYAEKGGALSAALVFWGFNQTFFTQFILGSRGMPRRYYNYIAEFQTLHQISTVGAYILGLGLFIALFTLIHSLLKGAKAPSNPWGAKTLEWTATQSPPIEHNFHHTPKAPAAPYDY